MSINIPIIPQYGGNYYIPQYGTKESAGCDIRAVNGGVIQPGQRSELIPTGLRMKIPQGYYCNIEPRSSLANKYGISVLGGIVDSDYTGEIFVILQNNGNVSYEYQAGERIAQFIFKPYVQATFLRVESLETTDRGSGGFGSTSH
jgi:dUTP pyrophosphatase